MTMRQLGELRRRDPELYTFMEEAISEKNRREIAAMEAAKRE